MRNILRHNGRCILLLLTSCFVVICSLYTNPAKAENYSVYNYTKFNQSEFTSSEYKCRNGDTDLAEIGCHLFSFAHAIQWVKQNDYGTAIIKDLLSYCEEPCDLQGHNWTKCKSKISHADSTTAYAKCCEKYGVTVTNIPHTSSPNKQYPSDAEFIDYFSKGYALLLHNAWNGGGHYVCAVDYVICDADGYIVNSDQIPTGGDLYLLIVDSSPASSTGNGRQYHDRAYSINSSGRMMKRSNFAYNVAGTYWLPSLGGKRWIEARTKIKGTWPGHRSTISVTGVSLNKTSLVLDAGNTETLTAAISPSDATNKSIIWSSSDTSVATVDSSSGLIMAKAAGSAVITATTVDGGMTASCTVSVRVSGKCGNNLSWTYLSGILTISGSGPMYEYDSGAFPWSGYIKKVKEIRMMGGTTISNYAFENNQDPPIYAKVTLPDTLTSIGNYAFYQALSLTTINIPDSVHTIGEGAFRLCTRLSPVHLPSSLTRIASCAFWHCNALTSIEIPENVTQIGPQAFANSGLTSVSIPESVTSIQEGAFKNCPLQTVILPTGLQSLGRYTFEDCSNLSTVIVRAEDTVIGGGVFNNCPNLTIYCYEHSNFYTCAVSPSNNWSVILIGGPCGDALYWDVSGSTLTVYGTGAMYEYDRGEFPWSGYIKKVKEIRMTGGTTISNFAFENNQDPPVYTKVTLPNTLTSIGTYAFYQATSLTTINIPDSVHTIGEGAFRLCTRLNPVHLPSSLTRIASCAFWHCNALTSIEIPGNITEIGPQAFANSGLTYISIPESVTSIQEGAFKNCPLQTVILPTGLQSLGRYAFEDCSSLSAVIVRAEDTVIGGGVFDNCPNLTIYGYQQSTFYTCAISPSNNWPFVFIGAPCGESLYWDVDGSILKVYGSGAMYEYDRGAFPWSGQIKNITEIKMTGGTTISDYAFENNQDPPIYTKVTLPDTLTSIGSYAFYQALSLKTINIPDSVSSIGAGAFRLCTKLNSLYLPSSLTQIAASTFWHCDALTTIEIPEGVQSIGTQAFANCGNLVSVSIPSTVVTIGNEAFQNDTSLGSVVVLPKDLRILGNRAFHNCQNLTTIIVRATDTVIGESVFENCPSPTTMYCYYGSTFHLFTMNESNNASFALLGGGPCGENLYWYTDDNILYIKGFGSMYEYESGDFPWSPEIGAITEIRMTGGTTISDYAFNNDQDGTIISKVTLPDTLTQIGEYAFYYNKKLAAITIPASVNTISNSAFRCCVALVDVNLPSGITVINNGVFYNCKNLESITIPEGVTYLETNAFAYCTKLQKVELPSTMTAFDHDVFNGCSSLEDIVLPAGLYCIGSNAFKGCNSLGYLYVSRNVTLLGDTPFDGCDNLQILCWDESVIHSHAVTNNIPVLLMDTPVNNPDFIIPAATETIEEEAFYGIAAKRVKLSESVTSIGAKAFAACPNLVGIYIPKNCSFIDPSAFDGCNNLEIFSANDSYVKTYAVRYGYAFVLLTE